MVSLVFVIMIWRKLRFNKNSANCMRVVCLGINNICLGFNFVMTFLHMVGVVHRVSGTGISILRENLEYVDGVVLAFVFKKSWPEWMRRKRNKLISETIDLSLESSIISDSSDKITENEL